MKIGIIGAGISGISAGRILQDKMHEVELFEKNEQPGGLVRCEWVNGNLYHKVGGHVFNTRITEVNDWFWKHFNRDKEFIKTKRNANILMNGKIIGYPIENHLFQLDILTAKQIIRELLEARNQKKKNPLSYDNFESFLTGNFGQTLYNLYFGPYNRKIWKTSLKTIPMHWLKGKLPMPDFTRIFESNILREAGDEMVHSTFFYPKRGGSQFIIDRLAKGLQIKTNFDVERLEYKSGKWYVNGEGPFGSLIYTADIRLLNKMLKSANQRLRQTTGLVIDLHSNSTSNIFCSTDTTDLSWLYLPGPESRAHRIIYTGNFSSENNVAGGRKTCVVEFSGKVSEKIMKEEIKKLPGNLDPISSNFEQNSYVIQDHDTRVHIKKVKQILRAANLYISGRFAEWEYYNMDTAIESMMSNIKLIP